MSRTPAAKDGAPPAGSVPLLVFLVPAQLEALALQAEDEGVEVQALARRVFRDYLHRHAAGAPTTGSDQ